MATLMGRLFGKQLVAHFAQYLGQYWGGPLRRHLLVLILALVLGGLPLARAVGQPGRYGSAISHDVDSAHHVVEAYYTLLNGPPGRRDWRRLMTLFEPGARMHSLLPQPGGYTGLQSLLPDDFPFRYGKYISEQGFWQIERQRQVHAYGSMAQVFSVCENRKTAEGKPMGRGVNAFQLVYHHQRWWIASLVWHPELPQQPLE